MSNKKSAFSSAFAAGYQRGARPPKGKKTPLTAFLFGPSKRKATRKGKR